MEDELQRGRAAHGEARGQSRLLATLEHLLAIKATEVEEALDQASDRLAQALDADKVDAFLYEPSTDTLVAVGTSRTPMGRREHAIGMDRLPIANGGRTVEVYQTGRPYLTGHADEDPAVLLGINKGLGVRSIVAVPLEIDGERRGVVEAVSTEPDKYSEDDLRFLQAVSRWIGMIGHRAELVERIRRETAESARRMAADELVTVVAHDLGNYLAPLAARIDLIHRRAGREGNERYLRDAEAARQALRRLSRLIDDLLDVARLDQGLFSVTPQPIDLVALVRETVETLAGPDRTIEVHGPEELIVEANPGRIRQALENLLANGLKHSPEESPITLELESETRQDGPWAVVRVRDQGAGIPPELLPRLFSRFAAGPGSTGLGLGLYLARAIVEAHGGRLTADSSPGTGTVFQMRLPGAPLSGDE